MEGYGGDNAKQSIKMNTEAREQIRQAQDEWREMEAIYKKEARKKKSKFSPEELEVQSELVKRLYAEIEKVKDAQMRGYARQENDATAAALGSKSYYNSSTSILFILWLTSALVSSHAVFLSVKQKKKGVALLGVAQEEELH